MTVSNPTNLAELAAQDGVEEAVFLAVRSQLPLAEIRAALPQADLAEVVRAYLHCFRIPIQQHAHGNQAMILGQVADLLYAEGEEVEGLTLALLCERFAPWLRAS